MEVDTPDGPSTSGHDPAALAAAAAATGCDARTRFVLELEFIQCLANPQYLNWLAQNRYLDDPAFKNYLRYLEYWRQPQYARYIKFPHCLLMLDLLRSDAFCRAVAVAQVADDIHAQQFYHWQHYRANRVREGTAALDAPAAGPRAAAAAGAGAAAAAAPTAAAAGRAG
ncbi:mediator of RNA polymerase II transcription subunit [Raphidocelis subcapitata]|uniref:Mediator of RNA polymerase II transcription subunit 31 n=1 Tax=Raphidocelis subcapitata TaxID=307507 RepID=A0A2V0NU20_9CHLO|nr:mediator of RNA polymerase II transcription subunit [Raphidocelis subcapitata]|eukprot:GBF91158.1 mediator of RNA polymerase II transcription subunit [Raphidocelis subcapitata]